MNPYKLYNTQTSEFATRPVGGHPVIRRVGDPQTFNFGLPDGYEYVEDFPPIQNPTPSTHKLARTAPADGSYGWTLVELSAEEIASRKSQPITKLTLMRRLQDVDKWSLFKAVLTGLDEDVQDAWALALDIRKDDPLFVENAAAIRGLLSMTEEEMDALLTP
jgi:hypothetical protein